MNTFIRNSPVAFKADALEIETRNHWQVVLKYQSESDGPHIIDLSHTPKWDLQDSILSRFEPCGIRIPGAVGESIFDKQILINRMNRTQASIWHLSQSEAVMPQDLEYTDVTESYALLALVGENVSSIMEKVSRLDLLFSANRFPALFQGPVLHVPAQVVVMPEDDAGRLILIACARGYGRSMAHGLLKAGAEWNLCPAGDLRFQTWLKNGR
jgi:hypothetical protein